LTLQILQRPNAKTQRRQALKVVYDSPQSLHKAWRVEIQEEAKPPVCEPQIRQELRKVNRENLLNRLDFHDDFVLNQQIEAISVVYLELAVIDNRHQLLGYHMQPGLAQLVNETYAVDALQKAWPQF
jgi:hypothetical protein